MPLATSAQESRARLVARAVQLAARCTPRESDCFPQAVAARVLPGLYGVPDALHFGVMRDPDSTEMAAHAWVAAGRVRVTGGTSFGHFTVVGCFAASQLVHEATARARLARSSACCARPPPGVCRCCWC